MPGSLPSSIEIQGFLTVWAVGSVVGVTSIYFDRKYVRATVPWHPSLLWASLQWFPVVSLLVAVVYMGKRIYTLGLDEHI